MKNTLCFLGIILLGLLGCSSSDSPEPSDPGSNIKKGSFFLPMVPPLSPNTVWSMEVSGIDGRTALGSAASGNYGPVMDRFFYVVNGIESDGSQVPTGQGASPPKSSLMVLTVNGTAPQGATAPNGGTGVGLAEMYSASGPAQLWKAVEASESGNFYLRSAESFAVSTVNRGVFSALVGFYPYAAPLDLGFLSTWNTSIYWNQEGSPTGDTSAFQQWLYDTETAQLTNYDAQGQLYKSSPTVWVAPLTVAPDNQWYFYPSYFVSQVVAQDDSDPPFPAAETPGETAAYKYISSLLKVSDESCTYEGTDYTGIRCEYQYASTSAALGSCQTTIVAAQLKPPTSFEKTPISTEEWDNVSTQIYNECGYAIGVHSTFNSFNTIITDIFVNEGDQITPLATDVGVSADQSLNPVPVQIVEGILYTVLSATGDPAAGVFANLMETAVNTAMAVPGNTLNQELATTVGNLYSDLSNQFQNVIDALGTAEKSILTDWGRLQIIGNATSCSGYNCLGFDTTTPSTIEAAAINGYKVTVMQQLMPLAYNPWITFSQAGAPTGLDDTTYNTYTYSTFGANTSNSNAITFYGDGFMSGTPSLTVMQIDIFDNGAHPFEVFNALNGWASLSMDAVSGENCSIAAITLFNATPNDFTVDIVPSEGTIAQPGVDQVSSESSWSGAELRPYGYLTLFAGANTIAEHLQNTVSIYLDGTLAGTLEVNGNSLCGPFASIGGTPTGYSGFSFNEVETWALDSGFNYDVGLWTTIYQ